MEKFLIKNNLDYTHQHKFDECKNINKLSFDFYLPDYNICIEYDGEQHFTSIEFFGGKEGLKNRIKLDKIKTKYCNDNNIKLIRIKYTEDIEQRLMIELLSVIS